MARKSRKKKIDTVIKVEKEVKKIEEPKKIEEISFDVAFSKYKKNNKDRIKLMKDAEAVELFIKKFIPSLEASQEEFNKVLEKY